MTGLRPPRQWHPLLARARTRCTRPGVGDLVAMEHAVWRVVHVADTPVLDDRDLKAWEDAGRPDLGTWRERPYVVRVAYVGGHIAPEWRIRDEPALGGPGRYGTVRVNTHAYGRRWHVYEAGRWPACSCCGEPMPCRAEMEDQAVEYAVEVAAEHERKLPGCCWACGEPVTSRQESVTYAGMNLDLPTAPPPQFHTRQRCAGAAKDYEDRWRAGDSARPRVLTWPKCRGHLVTHVDAVTECHGGEDGCRGHETHDHRSMSSCKAVEQGCSRVECVASEIRWIVLPKRRRRDVRAGQ